MERLNRTLIIQFGGLALVSAGIFGLSRVFPLGEWLGLLQQRVMQLGVWSALCYPFLYALCNVLLLPGGVLSVGGGFFFGLWWGFAIVLVGNLGGAAIAFWIGRTFGQGWLCRRLSRDSRLAALDPTIAREGWKIVLLSQLHPLFPTSLLNYLYGLTTIRFRTCMLCVAVGQAPGLFLYVYIGTLGQLGLDLMRGRSHLKNVEYCVWAGGLIFSALLLIALGRIALRLLEQADASAAQLRSTRPTRVGMTEEPRFVSADR